MVELVGEHELDQRAVGDHGIGDDVEPLRLRVIGGRGEVAGRLVGRLEPLVRAEETGDRAERVIGGEPEPALAPRGLAQSEPVEELAVDHLGVGDRS